MTANWTRPYFGVQHMDVDEPSRFQVTVSDYGSFAILHVFNLWNRPFTDGCDESTHDDAATARRAGESVSTKLGILKVTA